MEMKLKYSLVFKYLYFKIALMYSKVFHLTRNVDLTLDILDMKVSFACILTELYDDCEFLTFLQLFNFQDYSRIRNPGNMATMT